jgi:hypothetical protein
MGNYNPNYFEKKPGSLEEAILNAVNGVKTQIDEKVEYVEYKFKNKNDAMKAKNMLDGIQLMGFDINDDNISNGELAVDAGKKDMTKYHKDVMKQFKPKVMTQEKLDPVGKEDGDIDNDGDKDASDKYLAKRRKAVSKAIKGEEVKYPHMMYDPKTGKEVTAKTPEDHEKYAKMGYTHDKPKMEAYEMGTKEYADHTKKITPGQTTEDWNKQVDMMQEKNNSMRSILADMWGMDEGKNPFEKKEEKKSSKKEDKTMTGKPATKVSVDPDMNEKKK